MARQKEDIISGTPQAPQFNGFGSNASVLPLTKTENRIFILSNDKRKGTVSLDVEEDTIDPETGDPRRMRLLRGADSIWFDKQPPSVYPAAHVNKNTLNLEFDRGICIIPVREPLKIKAAELSMRNIANQKKYKERAKPKDIYFYEWNPVEQNKKAIEDENDVIKAMQLAMTTPIYDIIPHAQYLNIQFQDEMGVALNEDALRNAYIRRAKNDAALFLKSAHSPVVKMSHTVRTAISKGLIDLGKQPGTAYWTDGGFISTLPQERDAVEYLIEFAMTYGEANTLFANQLRELTS